MNPVTDISTLAPPPAAAAPRALDTQSRHTFDKAIFQFESLFVGLLLREALAGDGLMGAGPGREVLRGMVEDTFATEIAKTGAFGIGEQLKQSLIKNSLQKEESQE